MPRFLTVAACVLSLASAGAAFAQSSNSMTRDTMGNGTTTSHNSNAMGNGMAANQDSMGHQSSSMSHDTMGNNANMSQNAMGHANNTQ